MKTDILIFGTHPDDIEFGCGGILAKMADQGKKIAFVDLTLGEKGSNGTPEIRQKESLNAAKVIGASRTFLSFPDCGVIDSYEGRLELMKVIRHYRPTLVIGPYWKGEQTHPDHLACGQMVRFACRYARFSSILPEIPVHWVDGVLHYPPPTFDQVDFLIDISPYIAPWKEMMSAHVSQHQTFNYLDWNMRVASKMGVLIGVDYAQGLIKGNPIVVDDVLTIAKGAREI